MCKFSIWTISFCFLTVAYNYGEDGYELIRQSGIYNFVVVVKSKAGVCTGTVVNQEWILTAAHCLLYEGEVMENEDVQIIAGVTDYEYPRADIGQFRTSAEMKIHPDFVEDVISKFDIALIRVNATFEFNKFVGSIKIAGDSYPAFINQTNQCMSFGFGEDKETTGPSEQKALKVWNTTTLYGADSCSCTMRFQYKRLVCSRDPDYSRLCKGDDGGPLVCGNVVRAIAHMVRNWYTCDDPHYPTDDCLGSPSRGMSIYSLLCPVNDWMHEIVSEIPPTPATCRGNFMVSSLLTAIASLFSFLLICNNYFSS